MGILPESTAILSEKDLHVILKRDFFDSKEESVVLKIKLPSAGGGGGGGCTTPKAVDHKENNDVQVLKCPPPPRKPKSVPSTKRKAQRVLLDLSTEIESLFPSNILTDFTCGKIKKVRKGSS